MKKIIVTGIITLISIMALAALTYGQTSGHAGHAMPAATGGSDKDGHGMGPAKMEGCPMMGGQGKGSGMMGGHGKMGGPGMGHGMMAVMDGRSDDGGRASPGEGS